MIKRTFWTGLQQGDVCEITLYDGRTIDVVAKRTKDGYVRLEIVAPEDCTVKRIPARYYDE